MYVNIFIYIIFVIKYNVMLNTMAQWRREEELMVRQKM